MMVIEDPIYLEESGISKLVRDYIEAKKLEDIHYASTIRLAENTEYASICGEVAMVKLHGLDIHRYLKDRPVGVGDNGIDFSLDFCISGKREVFSFDVKTKQSTFPPRNNDYWVVDVKWEEEIHPGYAYIFCYFVPDPDRIYPIGWMPQKMFLKEAQVLEKGEMREAESGREFPNKQKCYCISIPRLYDLPKVFIEKWQKK